MARCLSCGDGRAEVLLIDTTLRGTERDAKRYCYACRPEAQHSYAGCLPRVIVSSSLPDEEKTESTGCASVCCGQKSVVSFGRKNYRSRRVRRPEGKSSSNFTIEDFVLLRDAGVQIAEADFLEVYHRENTHLDFTFCEFYGAETFQQHLPNCQRESILGVAPRNVQFTPRHWL
jgi:hypothetical protein